MQISSLCCTDGGFTGRSLSLVSKTIQTCAKKYKYSSIAIKGAWEASYFLQILETLDLSKQPIHHLLIDVSIDGTYIKPPSRPDHTTMLPRNAKLRRDTYNRRKSAMEECLQRFPPSPTKFRAADIYVSHYRHIWQVCENRILKILAPHLVTFTSTTFSNDPPPLITLPSRKYPSITFPKMAEINVRTFSMDWFSFCPNLQRMAVVEPYLEVIHVIPAECSPNKMPPLTHVAFDLPFMKTVGPVGWTSAEAVVNLKLAMELIKARFKILFEKDCRSQPFQHLEKLNCSFP